MITDLRRWAADTWASLDALTDPRTGLPADHLAGDLDPASRSRYTSPTNIGGLLWCVVVARELGLIDHADAISRLSTTLAGVARLDRDDSGLFVNWYDEATGATLTRLPAAQPGPEFVPFVSSVDNGWLAAGLTVVRTLVPELAGPATTVLDEMDLGAFYDPARRMLTGGYWTSDPHQTHRFVDLRGTGQTRHHTAHHYTLLDSEPRITSYLGIAAGQIPVEHYAALDRPTVRYRDLHLVPTFGGSMFEELMPDLFVPEASWSPDTWGRNHVRAVRGQREFGLDDARYGSWGFSPASRPDGGYREWGAAPIGVLGYGSDLTEESTGGPADGVVTPHALALALAYAPREAHAALSRLETDFDAYGPGGFYDAVAVGSGLVARRYLALDQAMVLGALGNLLGHDVLRRGLCPTDGPDTRMVDVVAPLIAADDFGLDPDPDSDLTDDHDEVTP